MAPENELREAEAHLAGAQAELDAWREVAELRKTNEIKDPFLTMLVIKNRILVAKALGAKGAE